MMKKVWYVLVKTAEEIAKLAPEDPEFVPSVGKMIYLEIAKIVILKLRHLNLNN